MILISIFICRTETHEGIASRIWGHSSVKAWVGDSVELVAVVQAFASIPGLPFSVIFINTNVSIIWRLFLKNISLVSILTDIPSNCYLETLFVFDYQYVSQLSRWYKEEENWVISPIVSTQEHKTCIYTTLIINQVMADHSKANGFVPQVILSVRKSGHQIDDQFIQLLFS